MHIDGPYFDDFVVGETLPPAPPITIGVGETALYQAIAGDPYALALSRPLVHAVTGDPRPIVNPALALHFSIGQSTVATRRVVANLFYRGVILHRPVRVGETLSTTVEVRGLRETTRKPDRPPRGMALLGIHTISDSGDVIADYERCALIPLRDPAPTGHADDLGATERPLEFADYAPFAPIEWNLRPLGAPTDWQIAEVRRDPMRDSVTDAPALVRLTQNQAAVHRDAAPRSTRAAVGLRRPHHRVGAGFAGTPAAVTGPCHRLAQLRPRGSGVRGRRVVVLESTDGDAATRRRPVAGVSCARRRRTRRPRRASARPRLATGRLRRATAPLPGYSRPSGACQRERGGL